MATAREENAKLAEQAERYEEMVEFMEKVTAATSEGNELTVEERNLLPRPLLQSHGFPGRPRRRLQIQKLEAMLRSFESEMETKWSFSAATLDFHPFLAIRRNSIYPLLPPSSSLESPFSNTTRHWKFSAGNDGLLCSPSSNTVSGFNSPLGDGFINDNKDGGRFHIEGGSEGREVIML